MTQTSAGAQPILLAFSGGLDTSFCVPWLAETYGRGRWRKLKAIGAVRLDDGHLCDAEVHWYEAAGIGKREIKIKRFLDG